MAAAGGSRAAGTSHRRRSPAARVLRAPAGRSRHRRAARPCSALEGGDSAGLLGAARHLAAPPDPTPCGSVTGCGLPARLVSQFARFLTGVEIHPGRGARAARLHRSRNGCRHRRNGDRRQRRAHLSRRDARRHGAEGGPAASARSADNVLLGAGAKLLGPIHIGDGCAVGANAVVLIDAHPNSLVVGVFRATFRPR